MSKEMRFAGLANRVFTVLLILALLYVTLLYRMAPYPPAPPSCDPLPSSHSSHAHNNLQATDEIIIILGYKLYNDGMPSRVLKDRVVRAVQLYKSMMEEGHHPLIIVSGKGKSDMGYTEAEAMKEICENMGVRDGDILIDSESSNTAQNAKFSAALIRDNKAIREVYVVTSDFHMARSQYIFQAVFPTDIELMFVPSLTSDARRREEETKEKGERMKSSQDDLIKEGILDRDDTSGYHPLRNLPRWQMIDRELEHDIKVTPSLREDASLVAADYGSNFGYFSVKLATKFPKGTVISLEGEADAEYTGATKKHNKLMKEEEVKNNLLCRTTVIPRNFEKLYNASQVFHYQLCLSVFHWFTMNTKEEFESALAHHLMNARTTFLELPEATKYHGKAGRAQHNSELVNTWYSNHNETHILDDVAAKFKLQLHYKFLGPILHDNGTVRRVFRIDLPEMLPNAEVDTALGIYKCKTVVGGSGGGT